MQKVYYTLEYPDENFTLIVKCIGRDFLDIKNVAINIKNIKDDKILWLIIVFCCLIIVLIFKFKNG